MRSTAAPRLVESHESFSLTPERPFVHGAHRPETSGGRRLVSGRRSLHALRRDPFPVCRRPALPAMGHRTASGRSFGPRPAHAHGGLRPAGRALRRLARGPAEHVSQGSRMSMFDKKPRTEVRGHRFTRNTTSCRFRLAGLRPLVLTRPSGPSIRLTKSPGRKSGDTG